MEKKTSYIKPAVRVIQLPSSNCLLVDSLVINGNNRFVDDSEWLWDDDGAQ